MSDRLLAQQAGHWDRTIEAHGPNFKGADYSNEARHALCHDQLLKIWRDGEPASVLDFGCGYGALLDRILARGLPLTRYTGFDIAESMLAAGRERHAGEDTRVFTSDREALEPADYLLFGGVFNVKLDADPAQWQDYVLRTLDAAWPLARKGLALNILTSYSEPEKMRPDLFYADPCLLFDYAKRHWSREVALLHDYGVWEFTLHVRRA
jgi:SAM-dependent methyltransferase